MTGGTLVDVRWLITRLRFLGDSLKEIAEALDAVVTSEGQALVRDDLGGLTVLRDLTWDERVACGREFSEILHRLIPTIPMRQRNALARSVMYGSEEGGSGGSVCLAGWTEFTMTAYLRRGIQFSPNQNCFAVILGGCTFYARNFGKKSIERIAAALPF